jgi:hypothetical protein
VALCRDCPCTVLGKGQISEGQSCVCSVQIQITLSWPVTLDLFVCTTTHCSLKAYCAILVRRSNFRYQASPRVSPRVSPRESTQRRNVEMWARNVREFYQNANLHVIFWDLLHAVKLRHGTDGFTSLPKEGMLRILSP